MHKPHLPRSGPAVSSSTLDEGHLVWFILDAVEEQDLSDFLRGYRPDDWGRAAYLPKIVAVLLYAYCTEENDPLFSEVRSSWKIEQARQENLAFKVITRGWVPDHTTIARFRQEFEDALGGGVGILVSAALGSAGPRSRQDDV